VAADFTEAVAELRAHSAELRTHCGLERIDPVLEPVDSLSHTLEGRGRLEIHGDAGDPIIVC